MPGEAGIRPGFWCSIIAMPRSAIPTSTGRRWQETFNQLKQSLKTNSELKQVPLKPCRAPKSDNDKAIRLSRYIRKNVRNINDRQVGESQRIEFYGQLPKGRDRTSAEILKSGLASSGEMNILFAAMASEAGLGSRPVLVSDKNDIDFNEQLVDEYFIRNVNMAVRIGDQWRVFDVSAKLLSPQMLSWRQEGTRALLADPKRPEFITAPYSVPDDSLARRTAKMSLSEDGTLEGDADLEWSGHRA